MNWNEVSIHTTLNSYPKLATPIKDERGEKRGREQRNRGTTDY
jgi:hypothetical protein